MLPALANPGRGGLANPGRGRGQRQAEILREAFEAQQRASRGNKIH